MKDVVVKLTNKITFKDTVFIPEGYQTYNKKTLNLFTGFVQYSIT